MKSDKTFEEIVKIPELVNNERKRIIVPWLEKHWTNAWWGSPNWLTTYRWLSLIWPLYFYQFYFDSVWNPITTLVIAFALITDFLDGLVAIAKNKVTKFGGYYDQLADKIFIWPIIYIAIYDSYAYLFWIVLILDLVSLTIKSTKYVYVLNNIAANEYGKAKFVCQCTAVSLFTFQWFVAGVAFIYLTSIFAIASIYFQFYPARKPVIKRKKT